MEGRIPNMQRDSYGNAIPAFLFGESVLKSDTEHFQNTYDSILIRVAVSDTDAYLYLRNYL